MTGKIIAIDLDHTICNTPKDQESTRELYSNASPMLDNINYVNKLFDLGHRIIIYTARGQKSCGGYMPEIIDKYYSTTVEWLKKNNVKYHELVFGKIYYDILIDDKAHNVTNFDLIVLGLTND